MLRRIRNKIIVISSTTLMTAVTILAFSNGQALAAGYTAQICVSNGSTNACVNAWDGGPAIDTYTVMGSEPNDELYVGTLNNGNYYLQFIGGGVYNDECIGDYNNSPTNASTGLDPCPTNSYSGGWGTNFKESGCSPEGTKFENNHWGGYLAPGQFVNETPWYLNHSGQYCVGVYPPSETD